MMRNHIPALLVLLLACSGPPADRPAQASERDAAATEPAAVPEPGPPAAAGPTGTGASVASDLPPAVAGSEKDGAGDVTETASATAPARSEADTVRATPRVGPGAAPTSQGVQALRAASRTYEGIRAFQASFRQTLENTLLGTRTTSRGMLYQRQPDRFLMRFTEPAGDVILSDGRHFWVYYPSVDEKQVIRAPAGEPGRSGIDLRAQFIGDPEERFETEYHGTETVRGRETHVLTLVPRREAGYRSLKVWIDVRDHLVRTFELRDHQGVQRRFELDDVAVNPTLPDSLFRFTPPPDARIIDRG